MWLSRLLMCPKHSGIINFALWSKERFVFSIYQSGRVEYSQYANEFEPSEDCSNLKDKIIYNSLISPHHYLEVFKAKKEAERRRNRLPDNRPVSLKLLDDNSAISEQPKQRTNTSQLPLRKFSKPNLPYQYSVDYDVKQSEEIEKGEETVVKTGLSVSSFLEEESIKGSRTWMNDYEKYTTFDEDYSDNNDWLVNYGTADPDVPASDVACGGCGANLHCREPSLPGYLPSEIFLECSKNDLLKLLCQRCHFLKNYNTALSVQVNPDKYAELIARVKPKALVLLLVDMTDAAGSVWPGIMDLLGKNRPIFLVGNKIDLLWGDSPKWLTHVNKILRNCVPQETRIINSCLISAKTGFGIEELVTKLQLLWKDTDDVYLVGCTNVGKSTLFNALIQSDYCKTKAVDLVQRATTAPWPGTTLNLLKFPILRPAAWRMALRNKRLFMERKKLNAERKLKKIQMQAQKKSSTTPPQLIGNISHTMKLLQNEHHESTGDIFSNEIKNAQVEKSRKSLVNSNDPTFEGRWCFDTPGVLHKDQILDLLTGEELLLTIPRELIEPRTFLLKQGMSLFIACLARLDYIKGDKNIRVTIFSSKSLPITVCKEEDADEVYKELLGSELSVVPQGSDERLLEWPGLSASTPMTLCGVDQDESCADITFSTTGWISITPEAKEICELIAWSPLGRGISVRYPPLQPFAVKLRGKKITKTPTYSRTKVVEFF